MGMETLPEIRPRWLTKENPKSLVLDHPSEAGFYVFDEEIDNNERSLRV